MFYVEVTTDSLSQDNIALILPHIVSVKMDNMGKNSPHACSITMTSGSVIRCDQVDGARVRRALETFYDQPPQS